MEIEGRQERMLGAGHADHPGCASKQGRFRTLNVNVLRHNLGVVIETEEDKEKSDAALPAEPTFVYTWCSFQMMMSSQVVLQ